MANMSYCRMENTYHDLSDCLEALENGGISSLSSSELRFAIRLAEQASYFSEYLDELNEEQDQRYQEFFEEEIDNDN